MGQKLKIWLSVDVDELIIDTAKDLGLTNDEWDNLSEADKFEQISDIVLSKLSWGFKEI